MILGRKMSLASHYTPEDLKDAQTKIDYLKGHRGVLCRRQGI